MEPPNRNERADAEIAFLTQRDYEKLERIEREAMTAKYTDQDMVRTWFCGFMAANNLTDEEREQLKEQGLLMK